MDALSRHALRTLFVTPERLVDAEFQAELKALDLPEIALVVIDEAHCISQWGTTFVPRMPN